MAFFLGRMVLKVDCKNPPEKRLSFDEALKKNGSVSSLLPKFAQLVPPSAASETEPLSVVSLTMSLFSEGYNSHGRGAPGV